MFLIPTTPTKHLLRSMKGVEVILPGVNRDNKRYFPDGEIYIKIPEAKTLTDKRVVVLHSGAPKPNEGLIELELILQILKDSKAQTIEVFFTYLPYGMQDKVFDKGESNVAENLVEKLLSYYRVKKVYIIDAHFAGKQWTKKYPLHLLSAVPILKQKAREEFGPDLLFLVPDQGGKRRTRIAGVTKKRKNSYDMEMESVEQSVQNRTVAVIDDLIETGGTLDRFYDECQAAGAKEVVALITHGVLPAGISRIKKKYRKIYLTNTIHRKEANVDITPLIRESLL